MTTIPLEKKTTTSSFRELGKTIKDLLEKGWPVDVYEVETETKTPNGIKFKALAKRKNDGTIDGELEGPQYNWKEHGVNLKFLAKTAEKGTFSLETSVEDKVVEGAKATLLAEAKGEERSVKASLDYKHKHAYINLSVLYPFNKLPTLNGNAVAKYEGFFLGGDVTFSVEKEAITKHNYKLGYETAEGNWKLVGYFNAEKDNVVGASLYHKVRDGIEVGADLSQKEPRTENPNLKLVGQYRIDSHSTIKARLESEGARFGVALKQKLSDIVTLTLAADLNAANIGGNSGHKFGFNLTFTP